MTSLTEVIKYAERNHDHNCATYSAFVSCLDWSPGRPTSTEHSSSGVGDRAAVQILNDDASQDAAAPFFFRLCPQIKNNTLSDYRTDSEEFL